jgi:transcriptional regulator with XRE-family HTH domain
MDINSEKLKSLRDEQPWSQDELATAAGLSLRTIQRAEREGVASLQTVKAIAAALNVDSSALRIPAATSAAGALAHASSTESGLGEPQTSWRRSFVIGAVLLVLVGGIAITLVASRKDASSGTSHPAKTDTVTTPHPADSSLAEKILGHWESSSSGTLTTLDLDGTMTNPGGNVRGNARYTILGDVISYGFNNRIVSARITFDSPTAMIWTTVETGTVIRFTRNKIVLPNREEFFAAIKGNWQGVGEAKSLEISEGRLKLLLRDGTLIDTAYLIDGLQVSLNRAGEVQRYAVTINSPQQMTWSKVYTPEKYIFLRAKP